MNIGKDIEVAILKALKDSERPLDTREISMKTGYAWHSIQTQCLKLQLKGLVDGFVVGRMNLWVKKEARK